MIDALPDPASDYNLAIETPLSDFTDEYARACINVALYLFFLNKNFVTRLVLLSKRALNDC